MHTSPTQRGHYVGQQMGVWIPDLSLGSRTRQVTALTGRETSENWGPRPEGQPGVRAAKYLSTHFRELREEELEHSANSQVTRRVH